MVWIAGRDMHVCKACGHLFAYRWASERYCSECREEKERTRRAPMPKVETRITTESPRGAVRAAELDARRALAELRAWMAQERATW